MKEIFSIKLISNVEFKAHLNGILNSLYGSGVYGLFATDEDYSEDFLEYFRAHLKWRTREEFEKVFNKRDDSAEIKAEYKEYLSKFKRALKTHKFLVFSIG